MSREHFGNYSWAADNNQANLEKHGWSFQSASIALDHGNPVTGNHRNDGRQESIARLNGETIKIVFERRDNEIQIISAHRSRGLAETYDAQAVKQRQIRSAERNRDFAAWRKLDRWQQRNATQDVTKLRTRHRAEHKQLSQRSDLGVAQRTTLENQLNRRQRLEAQQSRRPRLARDGQERAALARQQGREVRNLERTNERLDRQQLKKASMGKSISRRWNDRGHTR